MESPSMHNSVRDLRIVSDPNWHDLNSIGGIEGWRETCWFVKHETDELDGYLFAEDAEVRRDLCDYLGK